jgi:predicted DNA-binding transcriptional regulator AlpA
LASNFEFEIGLNPASLSPQQATEISMQSKLVDNSIRSAAVCIPFVERPTCSIADACQAVGLRRTKLYELMDEGIVQTVKIGRRRLVRVPSLLHFLSMSRKG